MATSAVGDLGLGFIARFARTMAGDAALRFGIMREGFGGPVFGRIIQMAGAARLGVAVLNLPQRRGLDALMAVTAIVGERGVVGTRGQMCRVRGRS